MNKRKLTERQAWREIARRIAEGEWATFGICWEVTSLSREGRITVEAEDAMLAVIDRHIGRDGLYEFSCGPWAFPSGEADVRVLASLLLAEESR